MQSRQADPPIKKPQIWSDVTGQLYHQECRRSPANMSALKHQLGGDLDLKLRQSVAGRSSEVAEEKHPLR